MTNLEKFLENIETIVKPLRRKGHYIADIKGTTPIGEWIELEIELEGCDTPDILRATLISKLEEVLAQKYDYEYDSYDEEDLHYDGGNFK